MASNTGLWAASVARPAPDSYGPQVSAVLDVLFSGRRSMRGISAATIEWYEGATAWLIEVLYQAQCSFPEVPAVLPRSPRMFTSGRADSPPFGHEIVLNVLDALVQLGWAEENRGSFDVETGRGWFTRIQSAGALRVGFREWGLLWAMRQPNPSDSLILMGNGKERRSVGLEEGLEVRSWQDNLHRINEHLLDQCIYLEMSDAMLKQLGQAMASMPEGVMTGAADIGAIGRSVNFAAVQMRRIFAKGSLKKGGRFYGGWWETVPSKHRWRMVINEDLTAECDFSGMALTCLYAMVGDAPGEADLYDVGIDYTPGDGRRSLVKKYINAMLNDERGRFRLSPHELEVLGVSQAELRGLVMARHPLLKDWFRTGVGLELQFVDSQIAEGVMLRFLAMGEVCLPIHDSFIVARRLRGVLEAVMREEFERVTGAKCGLKMDELRRDHIAVPEVAAKGGATAVQADILDMMGSRQIVQGYLASWLACHEDRFGAAAKDEIYDAAKGRGRLRTDTEDQRLVATGKGLAVGRVP